MIYIAPKRFIILFWIFVLLFGGLLSRLAYIQIVSSEYLTEKAISQQTQMIPLEIPARGQVLDRNLKPLTVSRSVQRVVIFPAAVTDKEYAAGVLAKTLGMDKKDTFSLMEGQARVLPQDLNREQINTISRASMSGVTVANIDLRDRKPMLASHILGYLGVGSSPWQWEGKMGIEKYYNEYLQGKPERTARIFMDAKGKVVNGLGIRFEAELDEARKDVVLTLDRDIQEIVETVMDTSGIKQGAVVVSSVDNGDILAMASRPDYILSNISGDKSFLNKCLSLYQPGSVFKVIVAAAALEDKVINPGTEFLCVGEKDELVKCYEKGGHGLLTFSEAVAYSCNPTFARVGLKVGAERLIEYCRRFGLDNQEIIGYQGTNSENNLQRIAQKYNLVNASLGQWPVEATVVQVNAAMAAIANDGVYMPPRLVKEIRDRYGKVIEQFKTGKGSRAVSLETAHKVQSMLEGVISFGTGKEAAVYPWGSAGKTGSAQVGSKMIDAWFSGYTPVETPEYAITVMVVDGESGGKTAAPIFREIAEDILELKS